MAISPALTANERASLNGVSTVLRYLSPIPETVIATARINQASYSYPLMQLTVDNTSADWLTVTAGMTVYIGTAAGLSDVGIYRVRLASNSTTLFIGETSSQDAGQIPISIRSAGFGDNQYITVIQDWRIWSVLPLINPATGSIYEDGTLTVGTNNTTPPPLVNVVCNGRRNHLATKIASGATFALSAVATPTSWPTSSGETFTYLWVAPSSGWTSVSGTTTTTITATVAPGNYVLRLTVTGSLSGATNRVVIVQIHDDTANPPLLISEMPRSDVRDRTGRKISFDLYNNRLSSIVNGAACLYFEVSTWANQWVSSTGTLNEVLDASETGVDVSSGALFAIGNVLLIDSEQMLVTGKSVNTLTVTRGYNGTTAAAHVTGLVIYLYTPATDVPTATRQMFGWVQRQDKSATPGLRQATIDLVSPSFLLSQLNSTSQIVQAVSSPANWQQVKSALSTASFMAWYMLRWRCANIILLFNYTPFSVAAAGQRLPSWIVDRAVILQQIQTLATERGNFGCDSEGEFYFLRHPNLVNYADRSGIVVRDALDASLYKDASNPRELMNRVQQVRGEAFSWDGSAVLPTPYYADAPTAPGQGTSQTKLPAQVVTGQSELNQLTGDRYNQQNNPYPVVNVAIQKNRDVYEPAQMEFVQVAIPAYLSADGLEYEANIVPISVTKTHNADGTSDIQLSGEGETHGLAGTYVAVPVGNDSIYSPPFTPPSIDPLPDLSLGDFNSVVVPVAVPSPQGPTVGTGKGAIWVNAAGTAIKRTFDITTEPPTIEDVTPSDAFFTAFVMVVHDKSTNFSRGAYALGNDGTNSKVAYTTDIYADTVQWEVGGQIDGVYAQMESAGMPALEGGVAIYGGDIGAWVEDIDLTASDGGFAPWVDGLGADRALYSPGVGWVRGGTSNPDQAGAVQVVQSIPSTNITTVTIYASIAPAVGYQFRMPDLAGADFASGVVGGGLLNKLITVNATSTGFWISLDNGTGVNYLGAMTRLIFTGTGVNPFTGLGSSNASVATSTNYGATWTEQAIGDSPGTDAAFCLSRFGTVALAAIDATLKKATSFGGGLGSVTGGGTTGTYAIAARIPWKIIGNPSRTNNGASPDFYLASAAAVSSETLWKVKAGVKTAITPAVAGTDAIGVGSNCIGTYASNRICFVGSVSGTIYIFTSTNSGTSWVYTAVSGATSVRAQRFSPSGLVWIAGTATNIRYSSNGGVTWSNRTVSGGGLYVEIFG